MLQLEIIGSMVKILTDKDDLRIAILKELEISIQAVSPDFMLSPRQKSFSIDG
jgi:hypothetical protein